MPTITTVDVAWTPGPTTFTDAEARRFDTAMFLGDGSPNGVRGGVVRHGDFSLIASINGTDQVTVQPGVAVIPGATGLGVYRAALSAATTATAIDPRNATNPRIDLIVFRATGALDIITGTPGASPSAPALPAETIEIGRITVPALGGGAATVSHLFRSYATALGGTIQVETASRLPGSGNQKGQKAIAIDTGLEHRWNGTAWEGPATSATYPVATAGFTGTVRTRVRSGVVEIWLNVTNTTGWPANVLLANIPAAIRPAELEYHWVSGTATATPHLVLANSNGDLVAVSANDGSLGGLVGSMTYLLP